MVSMVCEKARCVSPAMLEMAAEERRHRTYAKTTLDRVVGQEEGVPPCRGH